MRRALISLLAVVPLACAPAALAAPGDTGPCVAVAGTVVSVDATNNQFVGSVSTAPVAAGNHCPAVPTGPILTAPERFHAPAAVTTPVQLTFAVDPNTIIRINWRAGVLGQLSQGDRFHAIFSGTPDEPLATIVSRHTLWLDGRTPPPHRTLFAFVGNVTATDTTVGTLTVNVTQSFPSGLVPPALEPATFTVNRRTLILGANATNGLRGGSLDGVQVGDLVAGAVVGWSNLTLAQVGSLPLRFLLDLPSGTGSGGSGLNPNGQVNALRQVLALAGAKPSASHHHKVKTHKHAHSHGRAHSKTAHAKHA